MTSIGLSDEFYVNLLFDRSIYRPMCTHMGNHKFCAHCTDNFGDGIRGNVHIMLAIDSMPCPLNI